MKVRKFKIKIESGTEFRAGIISVWKDLEKHPKSDAEHELVLSFPNLFWLAKILSPERLRLIKTIKEQKPESIYQLAKHLGRATPNVQKDVHDLAKYRIIELRKIRKKGIKRTSLQPVYDWDGFDIAV